MGFVEIITKLFGNKSQKDMQADAICREDKSYLFRD
mgnify:CR=1 FL=1